MDLMNELLSKQKELNISVKNLRHAGSDFAEAQKKLQNRTSNSRKAT